MNYIKKREKKIRRLRTRIFARWSIALVFLLFAGVFSLGLWIPDAPSEWKSTTVQYHDIRKEWIAKRRELVITGLDGSEYVVQRNNKTTLEELNALLERGKSYSATYATTPLGVKQLRGLYCEDQVIIPIERHLAIWQKQRDSCCVGMWISFGASVLSWILIDRIWCRSLHQEIRKYKEEITVRIEK